MNDDPIPCRVCGSLILLSLMSDHRADMYRLTPVCADCKDAESKASATTPGRKKKNTTAAP